MYRDRPSRKIRRREPVKRIDDVRVMSVAVRAGRRAMAHPIRRSYVAMDNFYTVTVLNGAESLDVRYVTWMGRLRKGMDLYFERHDGWRSHV